MVKHFYSILVRSPALIVIGLFFASFATLKAGLTYTPVAGGSYYNIAASETAGGGFTLTGSSLTSVTVYEIQAAFDGAGSTWYTVNFSASPLSTGQVVTDGSGAFSKTITHTQLSATSGYPGTGDGTVRFRIETGGNYTPSATGGADYTIDLNAPTISVATIVSNNSTNTAFAVSGNTITLSITSSENISTPTVTIATQNASESGSGSSYTATLNVSGATSEGVAAINIAFSDTQENSGTNVTSTTNSSTVTVDRTVPTLSAVAISSDNTNSSNAKIGDVITIEITAAELLNAKPTVTIDGKTASVTPSGSSTTYTATRTSLTGDTPGVQAINISAIKDRAGNSGSNVTGTTNASSVTFDEVAPTLSAVTIASNNSITTKAMSGDRVTISITSSETIQTPTVTIATLAATESGSGTSWTAYKDMTSADPTGTIAFNIQFSDLAGNSGTAVTAITSGSNVTFDKTAPTLSSVTIASSNSTTTLAKENDVVTVSITASEDLATPSVTIAGATATMSGSGSTWSAQFQMTTNQSEGAVSINITFSDEVGNSGTTVTSTTDASAVTFDKTAPTLTTVSISSNNSTATLAKVGNTITLSIVSSESLAGSPTVTIGGNSASVTSQSATEYTATRVMTSSDVEGTVAINISAFTDLTGNAGSTVTAKTTGSDVTFDKTAPQLSTVTIVSDNSVTNLAKVGNTVTITLVSDENIGSPTVTIASQSATVSGSDANWSAAYTMTTSESEGTIAFNIAFSDLTGNSGTAVTATTNASAVTFDKTAPTLSTVTIVSSNSNNTAYAIPNDTITLSITSSETITPPTVTIAGGSATVSPSTNATSYTAIYEVSSTNDDGTAAINVAFSDLAGNAGTAVTATTNASSVTIDKTAPTFSTISIVSNNTNTAYAKVGDEITLTLVAAENLAGAPSIKIAGSPDNGTVTVTSSSATNYTGKYTMSTNDTEGNVTFQVSSFTDAYGNAGSTVSATTAASNVRFDKTSPTVSLVSSTKADGVYKAGESIPIVIAFNENVTITGTPQITLEDGSSSAIGSYTSGSSNDSLIFTYTVSSGDNSSDLDYVNTGSLALNGGSIADSAGNSAALTLATPGETNSLGANKALVIDTTPSTVSLVSSSTADGAYMIGDVPSIIIDFDETVYVTGTPQLTLETGSSDAVVDYTSGSGNDTLVFNYTIASGHSNSDLDYGSQSALALNGGTILDLAGNAATLILASPGATNSLGANKALVVDGIIPTVSSVTASSANKAYTTNDTILLSVIASEALAVTAFPKLTLETGSSDAQAIYSSGSGNDTLTFTYVVAQGHTSSDLDYGDTTSLSLEGGTLKDLAGNALTTTLPIPGASGSLGANKAIVIDTELPSVTLTYSDTDNLVRLEDGTLTITATFSDSIMTDSIPRISVDLPETTTSDISDVNMTRSSSTIYTYPLSLIDGVNGTISVSISARDKALNAIVADSVFNSSVVVIDNTDPAAFTTGAITLLGTDQVTGWINDQTDSLKIVVPVGLTDESLLLGGDVNIEMRIPGKMTSTTWQAIPSTKTTNPGFPADSIQQLETEGVFYRSKSDIVTQLTALGLTQGDTILTRAVINDAVGNSTNGTQSATTFVFDTLEVTVGSFLTDAIYTVNKDTVVSSDTVYAVWKDFADPTPGDAAASGINRFEYALQEDAGAVNGFVDWTSLGTDTTLLDTFTLTHNSQYLLSIRAIDVAGNTSTVLTSNPFRRWSSAPVLASIDSTAAYEDIIYSHTLVLTDLDLTTINSDTFSYAVTKWLVSNPDSITDLSVNTTTGEISWTPTPPDTGLFEVQVIVRDRWDKAAQVKFSDTTRYKLNVIAVNDTPVVDLSALETFTIQEDYGDTTIYLTPYATDEDNIDSTELTWSAAVLTETPDLPGFPLATRLVFGPGTTPQTREWLIDTHTEQWIRQGIAPAPVWDSQNQLILAQVDSKIGMTFTVSNDSTVATIRADSNYYGENFQVVFYTDDPSQARGIDTLLMTITPQNDPPRWATSLKDSVFEVRENDTIKIDFASLSSDVDDTLLTFTITPLTNPGKFTVLPSRPGYTTQGVSVSFTSDSLGDSVSFAPQLLWSDSSQFQVVIADQDTSALVNFVIDVIRVPRPNLFLQVVQNNAFTNFYEVIVTDLEEKAVFCSLEVQSKVITLDTVGNFTYVGHSQFTTSGTYTFDVFARGVVGDTSKTWNLGLAAAKTFRTWTGSSPDGLFRVRGPSGSVAYDQSILVIDSTLFGPFFKDRATYLLGKEQHAFLKSVQLSIANPEGELAIYQRTNGVNWQELPSLDQNGTIQAYTDRMGYFRLGLKTLVVPGMTSLNQNYPNPFNPVTTIVYDLGFVDGPLQQVNLSICNLLGQEVKTLVNETQEIGRYTIRWDGKDERGTPAASGVYFVRLLTNMGRLKTKKIMLLR